MGVNTTNLDLYKPEATETYNVTRDLNENWDKIDPLGVRYVTSKGVSGDWTWYKYSDNTMEAFADIPITSGTSWLTWGNSWYVTKTVNYPTSFGFNSKPIIVCSFDTGADAWGIPILTDVTTSQFKVNILRPINTTLSIAYRLAIHLLYQPSSSVVSDETQSGGPTI